MFRRSGNSLKTLADDPMFRRSGNSLKTLAKLADPMFRRFGNSLKTLADPTVWKQSEDIG